jgi:hypothetical protein
VCLWNETRGLYSPLVWLWLTFQLAHVVLQPAKQKLRQQLVDAMEVRGFVSVRRVSVRVQDVVAKT